MKKPVIHVNEITLSYTRKTFSQTKVNSSDNASKFAREVYANSEAVIDLKEYFFVIYLNRANETIGYLKVAEGGVHQTTVDSKLIFATALKSLASGIILVHNHPSGNTKPSETDLQLTKRICEAAKLLDLAVLDHIILTSEAYHSFVDNGDL